MNTRELNAASGFNHTGRPPASRKTQNLLRITQHAHPSGDWLFAPLFLPTPLLTCLHTVFPSFHPLDRQPPCIPRCTHTRYKLFFSLHIYTFFSTWTDSASNWSCIQHSPPFTPSTAHLLHGVHPPLPVLPGGLDHRLPLFEVAVLLLRKHLRTLHHGGSLADTVRGDRGWTREEGRGGGVSEAEENVTTE